MNDSFYGSGDYYLEHHGILGMKWGKQNGPPYPLSDAKHDKVIEKAKKRKNKIANDAKQLYKHKEEFTTDEMYEAINKIRANNIAKELIPKKKKKYKPVKLKGAKKRWAKDIKTLSKHLDDYSPEEFELAKEVLGRRTYAEKQQEDKFQRNLTKAERPLKIIKLGVDYLAGFVSGRDALKKMKPYNPNELTDDEKHHKFLVSNGFAFMSKYARNLNDLSKNDVFRGSILRTNPIYQQSYDSSKPKKKTTAEVANSISAALLGGNISSLPIEEQKQFMATLATPIGREQAAQRLGVNASELYIDPGVYKALFGNNNGGGNGGGKKNRKGKRWKE